MAIYVDNWRQRARFGAFEARWSHLLGDTEDELHHFAARLGLRRSAFQDHHDPSRHHYDVPEFYRARAIGLGATAISWRQTGAMIRTRRATPPRAER